MKSTWHKTEDLFCSYLRRWIKGQPTASSSFWLMDGYGTTSIAITLKMSTFGGRVQIWLRLVLKKIVGQVIKLAVKKKISKTVPLIFMGINLAFLWSSTSILSISSGCGRKCKRKKNGFWICAWDEWNKAIKSSTTNRRFCDLHRGVESAGFREIPWALMTNQQGSIEEKRIKSH